MLFLHWHLLSLLMWVQIFLVLYIMSNFGLYSRWFEYYGMRFNLVRKCWFFCFIKKLSWLGSGRKFVSVFWGCGFNASSLSQAFVMLFGSDSCMCHPVASVEPGCSWSFNSVCKSLVVCLWCDLYTCSSGVSSGVYKQPFGVPFLSSLSLIAQCFSVPWHFPFWSSSQNIEA